MNFYNKYIFPHLLSWTMRGKKLDQYRKDTVSQLSGIGLEIGFGAGNNIPFYRSVSKLYALDLNEGQNKLAKNNIRKAGFSVEYILASAEHIPLPDNSLDFVVSTWTLCSIPNPERALREVSRVLKPEGIFSCVEHGLSSRAFITKMQNVLTPISKCCAGGCHLNRDIRKLIVDTGFVIMESNTISEQFKPLRFMYTFVTKPEKS